MTDPCQQQRDRVAEIHQRISEIEEFLPEAPPGMKAQLKKELESLRKASGGAANALAACIDAHTSHDPPPPPEAVLRSDCPLNLAVTSVIVATLPARRAVAAAEQVGVLTVFDSETGELIRNRSFDGAVLRPPELDPSGDSLVVLAGSDKVLRVLDQNGETRWQAPHPVDIPTVALSPRSGELAVTGTGFGDKQIRAFAMSLSDDAANHHPLWERPQPSSVLTVAVSGDDKFVAATCKDRTVRLFNAATGDTLKIFEHEARLDRILFSPTGALLAVTDVDGAVQLIDTASKNVVGTIIHPTSLAGLAFNGDGTLLATVTVAPHSTVQVWKAEHGESEKVFASAVAPATVTAIAFSPTERRLAIATSAGDPKIVDPLSGGPVTLQVPSGVATALAYSPDGRLLIVGTEQHAKVFNVN